MVCYERYRLEKYTSSLNKLLANVDHTQCKYLYKNIKNYSSERMWKSELGKGMTSYWS